jgi:hypothetical protein
MTPQDAVARHQLEERMKSGAHWFYWIAALSLVTSIISLSGSDWAFMVSLGVTQLIDAVAKGVAAEAGWGFKVVAFVFDVVAAGVFAVLGYFAVKRNQWAFVAGIALYGLDALVCALVGLWFGLAFHAFALFSIFGGYKACTALDELDKQAPPPPAPEPAPMA